jgi:DEAD/DEAH box helicase domain-containing protein
MAMDLTQLLDNLKDDPGFSECVTRWEEIPAKPTVHGPFPEGIDRRIVDALRQRGIDQLYSHQTEAIQRILDGHNVVVVTPTASGKTMCYNIPVLNSILENDSTRTLYVFPTKALAQDQVAELQELIEALGVDIKTYTYDGDTPQTARKAIRLAGHIVVTNPEMLHTGIMPHHTKWVKLFENLKYIVIDELHQYRGVFGSHLANVIRRLRRICSFYGSNPKFVLCSATIANPAEMAEKVTGEPVEAVDKSGAPTGRKTMVFYNPPVVNRQLGIRQSSVKQAERIARHFIANDIQTIVFGRSRMTVEIVLSGLLKAGDALKADPDTIRGYRGGYLPLERREIERGLRDGSIRTVVSTNALELGVDIGSLDAAILIGYPGTIASTWQQAGRAGRRNDHSAAVLIASSSPLDQYVITHPDYVLGKSPESGLVNPDNLYILVSHLKCAAFELPFADGERFGRQPIGEVLQYLEDEGVLHHSGDKWFWSAEAFPAEGVSLRSSSVDNVVIIDTSDGAEVVGEVDWYSAMTLVHEEAIYIHSGQQYQVEKLDYDEKKAYVRPVDVDYYTDANLAVNLKVLTEEDEAEAESMTTGWGDVEVTYLATIFKKIKLETLENVGWGRIALPQSDMHTQSFWLSLSEEAFPFVDNELMQNALVGLGNLLVNVVPLYLLCDRRDLGLSVQVKSPFTGRPTIYIWEKWAGGIGLSERLFEITDLVLQSALELVAACECESGCPACVGPLFEVGPSGKQNTIDLLTRLVSSAKARMQAAS